MFVFRFLFDNISLFLEACFEVDLRSKMINIGQAQLKKVEERNMIL